MKRTKSKKSPTVTVTFDMLRRISALDEDGRRELEEVLNRVENSEEASFEESVPTSISDETVDSLSTVIVKSYRRKMKARQARKIRAAMREPSGKSSSRNDDSFPSYTQLYKDIDISEWATNHLQSTYITHTDNSPCLVNLVKFDLSEKSLSQHCLIGKYFDKAVHIVIDALIRDGRSYGVEVAENLTYIASLAREILAPMVYKAVEYSDIPVDRRPESVVIPFFTKPEYFQS